ncbi:hypothetical protein D3C87_112080 [compost metagenome]
MKTLLSLSLFIALFSLSTATLSYAQEDSDGAKRTTSNPGEDPNEAMVGQGSGVPNYGCPDSSRACYAKLKHGRIGDDTTFRPSKGGDTSGGTGTPAEGTR